MCYPWVVQAVQVAVAVIGAYSSVQQGQATAAADTYNAQIQERNAQSAENEQTLVKDQAAIERRRLGERVRAERGDMVAKFTAMGVDPGFGSPADLVGDVNQAYSIDRNILGRNEITSLERLDKDVADYRDAATMSRRSAKGALKAGYIGAVGSILNGAANVSSRWIMPAANQNADLGIQNAISTGRKPLKLGAG